MAKRKLKRKATLACEDIEINISDVENERLPIEVIYTVETVSNDARRINRDQHRVQIADEKGQGTVFENLDTPADVFFTDLSNIDPDAVRVERRKHGMGDASRKRRYVSSVRLLPLSKLSYHLSRMCLSGQATQKLDTIAR